MLCVNAEANFGACAEQKIHGLCVRSISAWRPFPLVGAAVAMGRDLTLDAVWPVGLLARQRSRCLVKRGRFGGCKKVAFSLMAKAARQRKHAVGTAIRHLAWKGFLVP